MPWNEPGGNETKKPPTPPDLDKILSDLVKKMRGFVLLKNGKPNTTWKPAGPTSKDHHYGFGVTMIVLLVIWAMSGLFIVNPAEEAVVLRFGKYADVLQPGLHWMARFIDTKYVVDVQKIYSFTLEGDFLTKSSNQNDLPNPVNTSGAVSDQSKNLVNVELNVQYRITDPRAYLFNTVNPDETVEEVAAGALSDVIGKMKLDDVLTTGREFVSSGVQDRAKQILSSYQSGVDVVAVTLRKVQAPDQVRSAFNDVNRADQDRATTIQQAQAYASKVVPIAQGAAARILADATGYQQQVVLTAQADIAKYNALLKVYSGSPDITRERMYLETMQTIFDHTTKVLVDFNTSNNMLYLPLNKILNNEPINSGDLQGNPQKMTAMNTVQQTAEAKHDSN